MSKFDHLRGVPGSRNRLAAQVWDGARVGADPAEVPEPSDVRVPQDLRATIEHLGYHFGGKCTPLYGGCLEEMPH